MKNIVVALVALLALYSCSSTVKQAELLPASSFDTILTGERVALYTLKNKNGMVAQITSYGARVVALWVPSNDGLKDVVWGYPSIRAYLNATDIFAGPIVGRYGNRIAKGQLSIGGKSYRLTINNNGNHLHGGTNGFFSKVWDAKLVSESVIELTYVSAAGEEGYPGNMAVKVTYTLTNDNGLQIAYEAKADAPTVVNLTSHSYFNLHGTSSKSSNSHILTIYADSYTPTDSLLIPTGRIERVEGTPLDFRSPKAIGDRIEIPYQALKYGKGYDHNWVLRKDGEAPSLAAEVYEPETGILMKVYTDQKGLQFYSGNFMDGVDTGKRGDRHGYRTGIALETQNFPDAPNHSNFPSSELRPGEVYRHLCRYTFEIK